MVLTARRIAPRINSDMCAHNFGGAGVDTAYGIALRADGHAYVTGVTSSTDFPAVSAIQATKSGAGGGRTPSRSG